MVNSIKRWLSQVGSLVADPINRTLPQKSKTFSSQSTTEWRVVERTQGTATTYHLESEHNGYWLRGINVYSTLREAILVCKELNTPPLPITTKVVYP